MATSHLSRPMALSSMMVPTFTENCRFACFSAHSQTRLFFKNDTFVLSQVGHLTIPSGQRNRTISIKQVSASAKCLIACCRVRGLAKVTMGRDYKNDLPVSSILLPNLVCLSERSTILS